MPESVARIASFVLAGAFLWAGAAKLLAYHRWRAVVVRYALPHGVTALASPLVPLLEVAIAIAIVVVSPRGGAVLALAAVCVFSLAVLRARSLNGDKLPCGCFGGSEERHYSVMMMRNFLLALIAAVVLRGPDAPVLRDASMPSAADLVPATLIVVGIVVVAWMSWQVAASSRRREHL